MTKQDLSDLLLKWAEENNVPLSLSFGEDNEGQLIIYTDLQVGAENILEKFLVKE